MDLLRTFLQSPLLKGLEKSRKREAEIEESKIKGLREEATDLVRLHFSREFGGDFKLEMWVCSSAGNNIAKSSFEDLEALLGNCIFSSMEASNSRKEEVEMGISMGTKVVAVFPSNGDNGGDHRVEIMMDFDTGLLMYTTVYRS